MNYRFALVCSTQLAFTMPAGRTSMMSDFKNGKLSTYGGYKEIIPTGAIHIKNR
jgi:hypothetical protein